MSLKTSEDKWIEEFKSFAAQTSEVVPRMVSDQILARITAEMRPSVLKVFAKLLGIHGVVGTLSLAICNQFGLSPFPTHFSLSDYFMRWGHSVCMFCCGVLFIGLTVLLSQFVLSVEEFKVFSKNSFLQVFTLSVFSLVSFLAFGAEMTLGIALFWLVGALLGGLALSRLPRLQWS